MRHNVQGPGAPVAFFSLWSFAAFENLAGVFGRPTAGVKDRCHALRAAVFQAFVFCTNRAVVRPK